MAHPVVLLYAGSGSSHKVTEQCCNVVKCIRFNNTADISIGFHGRTAPVGVLCCLSNTFVHFMYGRK